MKYNFAIKVCGMRDPQNMADLLNLAPEMMGMIFYNKSSRNVADDVTIPARGESKIIGVFVNADLEFIKDTIKKYSLAGVQLHGSESVQFCEEVKKLGVLVIKVFSVGNSVDFSILEEYKSSVDFFLFDTKGKLPGGNGAVFNWDVFKDYDNEIPFILSGGISIDEIDKVFDLQKRYALNIHGIDVNPQHLDITFRE